MNVLAAVNWEDIVLVGTALGIFKGVSMIKGIGSNGNGKFNKALCEERHLEINKKQDAINANFNKVFEKLDHLTELLMK